MSNWDKLSRPPASALKQIGAGRLKGFTDINPQWRYQIMDKVFGQCGVGWKYEVADRWTEAVSDNQVFVFVQIHMFTKEGDNWSSPIPGMGGSALIAKEKSGLHSSDEAYKMALTDALSVAMKQIGVAADIYAGLWDSSNSIYKDPEQSARIEQFIADIPNSLDGQRGMLKLMVTQLDNNGSNKSLHEWASKVPDEELSRALIGLERKKIAKGIC